MKSLGTRPSNYSQTVNLSCGSETRREDSPGRGTTGRPFKDPVSSYNGTNGSGGSTGRVSAVVLLVRDPCGPSRFSQLPKIHSRPRPHSPPSRLSRPRTSEVWSGVGVGFRWGNKSLSPSELQVARTRDGECPVCPETKEEATPPYCGPGDLPHVSLSPTPYSVVGLGPQLSLNEYKKRKGEKETSKGR